MVRRDIGEQNVDTPIDWLRLGRAHHIFSISGYTPVEVSWMVPRAVQEITCPYPENIMEVPGHSALVGSAEQSFIHMTLGNRLSAGRYVALTPCFRNEKVDASHRTTFMKVELYATGTDLEADVRRMIADAMAVMAELSGVRPQKVSTRDGWDLEINGVEVGSYGVRAAAGIAWAYGTGIAEPRFSYALSRH